MHTHHWPAQQRVHTGHGAIDEALPSELGRLGWQRVLLVTTRSLRDGPLFSRVERAIGERLRGAVDGIPAHSPIDSVTALVDRCRRESVDGLVALGGGSVIDACKGVLLALNGGLGDGRLSAATLLAASNPRVSEWPDRRQTRMIAIPTTLSAAEFTSFCGITDTQAQRKLALGHPSMIPISVIQDPTATVSTPARLLLSTGARSVDHAIEGFCAINATPFSDATAVEAGRRLFDALPALTNADASAPARTDAQAGAWLSIQGRANGVAHGASHGIGYLLGAAFGVPHGETSCVMLPAVLRWNASVNADRQAAMRHRLDLPSDATLATHVENLFASLGLPTRLSQVGVTRAEFDRLTDLYDGSGPIATNPRAVRGRDDLLEILDLAA
ncbi:MAG: iron-containing alcohol dehydrogenase [Burkholderiaceae bacterium]